MTELGPEQRPPSREEIEFAIREHLAQQGLPSDFKVVFPEPEIFIAMSVEGAFVHALPFIDSPLFNMALENTIGWEEGTIAKKKPATISGYFLYDNEDSIIGFTCFESQVEVNHGTEGSPGV
jgi:hypothetical protein